MKRQSIMLGNGINRCMIKDISWGDLFSDIANKYSVELNINISFPMQFETVINQIPMNDRKQSKTTYKSVKKEIVEKLNKATPSDKTLHKLFAQAADTIITTNYNHFIEKSLDDSFTPQKAYGDKFNLNNYIEVNNKKIYHIHGSLNYRTPIEYRMFS